MLSNVNMSSPAASLATLQKSVEQLNQLNREMVEQTMELSEKMLKVAVADKVQHLETSSKIDILA